MVTVQSYSELVHIKKQIHVLLVLLLLSMSSSLLANLTSGKNIKFEISNYRNRKSSFLSSTELNDSLLGALFSSLRKRSGE